MMQSHEIDYKIVGDDMQIVEIELDPGETVIAEGKLERVQQHGKHDYYRLLLGSKPSDHMILC